jgi:thiamine-phosphate pyrophosphorylase
MIVVLTNPTPVNDELSILHRLFDEGLEVLQIYKPGYTLQQINIEYSELFKQYPQKVCLHTDFKKFHSLIELANYNKPFQYAFLSPIFDSISKTGYKSTYNLTDVKNYLHNNPTKKIVALGGIDEDKISIIEHVGFYGIALLGALWCNKAPVEKFKRIKKQWEQIKLTPTY